MKKCVLGDITFTIHNKREELWFNSIKWQVETLYKYISDPSQLSEYTESAQEQVIATRLHNLHGELNSAFWLDIIKDSVLLYTTSDFESHFM